MTRAGAGGAPRRGYADGPFGQIHYLDPGVGRPLVLLHQAPLNAHQFDAVFGPLAARGVRAIAIDLPGFGQSDPPGFTPAISDYALAVPPVLDHLGLQRADLLGHHTGALVATEVALAFADRVDRLILNGPLPLTAQERDAFMQDVETREKGFAVLADGSHLSTAFAGRANYCAGSVGLERINQYILWMVASPGPFWYGHHAAFLYDHAPRLLALRHPTLILTNSGDAIYEQALRTHALRPDWPMVVLDGGGIDIQDQAPDAWAAAVAEFLSPAPGTAE